MRPYLNNYIETLSRRRQERVGHLLDEARVGKEQLADLKEKLEEASGSFDLVTLDRDQANRRIDSSVTAFNAQQIESRVSELYELSNLVSLMLNSHTAVLASDVKALEDELLAMEKMALNFAFLLSDNQAFDYTHLESFSDELARDEMKIVPDRGAPFGPAAHASVRSNEGVLTLGDSFLNGHGLVAEVLKGNATSFIISDSDVSNVVNSEMASGWRMVIAASSPITSAIPEAEGKATGAQALLEFTLSQPAPSSEIKISPYADMPVDVVQVITYPGDDDANAEKLLDAPRKLDRPLTLHFPIKTVKRFQVVLSQPVYRRTTQNENVTEYRYRKAMKSTFPASSDSIAKAERRLQESLFKRYRYRAESLPHTAQQFDRGPMSRLNLPEILAGKRHDLWRAKPGERAVILFEAVQALGGDVTKLFRSSGDFEISQLGRLLANEGEVKMEQVYLPEKAHSVTDAGANYYYSIGLHHVGIGLESPGFRGVFVSKPLPAPGDIGEIRVKTSEDNYVLPVTDRHSNVLTSVEYSVSNRSNPVNENDWIPILPVGQSYVSGERLFPNENGVAHFRFPAQASQLLRFYRNGYEMAVPTSSLYSDVPGAYTGVKIDRAVINPVDILTVDYLPVGDPSLVSFEPFGFNEIPLVSAHSKDGAGESFLSTGDRNTITLGHYPYINPTEAAAGGYQPITVRLSNGVVPQNLTDYKANKAVPLPVDGYYYIHSGDTIMFNQPILTPFRVYYEYLQNNVRVRTVLRCNTHDLVSPKVDYVHVKAKTRRADQRRL